MKLQLWRNATLQLNIHHSTFLIDPMLGRKGSFGAFPWMEDKRPNPLVELPFLEEALRAKLKATDAVFVSHLHPDHWDEPAVRLLDKATPIICPEAIDAHQPQHIIVAGGAATFAIGQPVTMTAQHIKALAAYATHATIWITHLEAVSPCTENRAFLSGFLDAHRLQGQCNILGDGAEAVLTF